MTNSVPRVLVTAALVAMIASAAVAREPEAVPRSRLPGIDVETMREARRGARLETLWIFDADFSDESGDNAGWTSYDVSGTVGYENAWHKDTIRIRNFEHLGDSTWWCGVSNPCWQQPRGYGNHWRMILKRSSRPAPTATWCGTAGTTAASGAEAASTSIASRRRASPRPGRW